jgi:hypothetical protein
MLKGTLSVGKLLLTSAGEIRRLRKPRSVDERYVRPSRRYELPPVPKTASPPATRERYLRPTRFCNSQAPTVIALADGLGKKEKTSRDFAEAAFAFTKEQLTLEIGPIDSVEATLERGTGTCFDLISVFIALCRAGGIPARYKIFATEMIQAWREAVIDVDPLVQKWYDSLGYFLLEGEGEAYIDGQWVVAHVGPTAERQAAAGIPITRLGEDALDNWFAARPDTIMRLEALPAGLAVGSRILYTISPGSMERINVSVQRQIARGRQIIRDAGDVRTYDESVRKQRARPRSVSGAPADKATVR